MKKQQVYCTHCFYSESGKRMSIFAEKLNDKKLIVSYLYCSKQDSFNKHLSWKVWNMHNNGHTSQEIKDALGITLHHTLIDIEGYRPKREFIEYCRDNFYRMEPYIATKQKYRLVKANNYLINKFG